MGDFSLLGEGQELEAAGAVTSTSGLTLVATGGSTNTKGSWVQLTAATAFDADGFWLNIKGSQRGSSVSNSKALIDIGIGGAGSEQVIISNFLHYICSGTPFWCGSVFFPISIPAGTRVAARAQAGTLASGAVNIPLSITPFALGLEGSEGMGGCTGYGANTGTSGGVTVTSSASSNTMGSWSEVTSSTTNDAAAVVVCLAGGTVITPSFDMLIDIGIGASGSEQIVIPKLAITEYNTNFQPNPPLHGPFFLQIPAGTRLAARCQDSAGSAFLETVLLLLEP